MSEMRWRYIVLTILLFCIEVIIALFVHDSFIRPYIGDILVVILMYFAARIVFPIGIDKMAWYILIFALLTEILQFFRIVQLLGLGHNKLARIVIGTTFDIKDIICYIIGFLVILIYEKAVKEK